VEAQLSTIDVVDEALTENPDFFAWLKQFNPKWELEFSGDIMALLLAWRAGYDQGVKDHF
jgi:hypothetical protein